MWLPHRKNFLKNYNGSDPEHVSFVLGIASGSENAETSTFINHLGWEEILDTSNIKTVEVQQEWKLYRFQNNIIQVIKCNDSPSMTLQVLDGIIIVYDSTSKKGKAPITKITNDFIQKQIPCLLIGLKSDLTAVKTVDPDDMWPAFGVQLVELEDFTAHEVQVLKASVMKLVCSDPHILKMNQHQNTADTKFTAAPTRVPVIITTPPTPPPPPPTQSPPPLPSLSSTTIDTTTTSTTSSSSTTTYTTISQNVSLRVDEESIRVIINKLLSKDHDETDIRIFLMVFRKFMTPSQLVETLIAEFKSGLTNQDDDCFASSSTTTKTVLLPNTRQEGICYFIEIWLSHYLSDFKNSDTRQMLFEFLIEITTHYQELFSIYDKLSPLLSKDLALKDRYACWGMVDGEETAAIQRRKDGDFRDTLKWHCPSAHPLDKPKNNTFQPKPKRRASVRPKMPIALKCIVTTFSKARPTSESWLLQKHQHQQQRNKETCIVTLDHDAQFNKLCSMKPTQLAEQLTWIDQEIFNRIQPRDFLCHLWSSHQKSKNSGSCDNPVSTSIEHFNFVSGWIASLIVDQSRSKKRERVFLFCLELAVELRRMNNFNTLMAVMAGINSAAVWRLEATKLAVKKKNKKLFDQFIDLNSLMSSESSFRRYRDALDKATGTSCIPYLGIHQQDLVSSEQGNKDLKDNGKVHWEKFQLIGSSILKVVGFQRPTYTTITPNSSIISFIEDKSTETTEDERYEKSIQIEPKTSSRPSRSTNSALSWLLPRHVHNNSSSSCN